MHYSSTGVTGKKGGMSGVSSQLQSGRKKRNMMLILVFNIHKNNKIHIIQYSYTTSALIIVQSSANEHTVRLVDFNKYCSVRAGTVSASGMQETLLYIWGLHSSE